jgi:putative sigma-54 modulation protein
MNILFTGRKAHLTDDLKGFVEQKLAKLERILHEDPDAHVILSLEKHRHLAEIIVKARIGSMTAKANGGDFLTSAGLAADRVLAQARRLHEKIASSRKRGARRSSSRRGPGRMLAGPDGSGSGEDNARRIVAMNRVPLKPMSIDEAIQEMETTRGSFLLFRNASSQQVSVVFRRDDGRFGLIEPEA